MSRSGRRSTLILVLGGAASGKSDFALQVAMKAVKPTVKKAFVATGEGLDEEMAKKIAKHRRTRSSAWETAEVPRDVAVWMRRHGPEYGVILVDCLTMWLSNRMDPDGDEAACEKDLHTLLQAVRQTSARVVMVGNELGMGLVPADPESRRFRELSGRLNRLVADEADEAYMVVAGLSIRLK